VWAKVRCVCCVVLFPKFNYSDLLPTCQNILTCQDSLPSPRYFAKSLTSPQQVGNFPIYGETCLMDFGQSKHKQHSCSSQKEQTDHSQSARWQNLVKVGKFEVSVWKMFVKHPWFFLRLWLLCYCYMCKAERSNSVDKDVMATLSVIEAHAQTFWAQYEWIGMTE